MSNLSRRTALSILGLAPATVAIAGEDLTRKAPGCPVRFGMSDKASAALRALADDIDAGGSLVSGLMLNSAAKHDDFLVHTLSIDFSLMDDLPPKV